MSIARLVADPEDAASRYIARRIGVEKVRITNNGEVEALGVMPNSNQRGWYFAGYVDDLAVMAKAEGEQQ